MTYDEYEKLKKLEELKTNGTLTEEEFQREKERILNEETRQSGQTGQAPVSTKKAFVRAAGKCLSHADASFAICRLDITGPGFRAPHCHVAHQ